MGASWLAIPLTLATLGGLLAALGRCRLPLELARKLVHVCMGLGCLVFPWVFGSVWPALLLAALATGALWALRRSPGLRRYCGGVLDAVGRRSYGDLCFPAGVCAAFVLAGGDPLRYAVPLLALACADPAAALVGLRWGRRRYATPDGTKTVEGSLAFCATTFATTFAALSLAHTGSLAHGLLVAALLGLLLMAVEGLSWAGLDNLTIPVVGTCALIVLQSLSVPLLAMLLVAMLLALALLALSLPSYKTIANDLRHYGK